MINLIISAILSIVVVTTNLNLSKFISSNYDSRLICVNEYTEYMSFGFHTQIADMFWIRFLQELDAYNQLVIAEPHLCPDKTSSWHFHIMNVAFGLDSKFYELFLYAPLLISVTIGDSKGASVLFDKAVANYPDDWRILYRAAYQAQIEEKNMQKAADLFYRAGKNGAPRWVMSLAGGIYNETGHRQLAVQIYTELIKDSKDQEAATRLRAKLDNKLKNYFKPKEPEVQKSEHK